MLRYVGEGKAIIGIPARDLRDEEVKEYGGEDFLVGTGLYEKMEDEGSKAVRRKYEDKAIFEKGDR